MIQNFNDNSSQIETRLGRIEKMLENLENREKPKSENNAFIDIEAAAKLVNLKKSTIYKMVHERKIPHYKIGKRLVFKQEELLNWIEKGKKPIVNYEN